MTLTIFIQNFLDNDLIFIKLEPIDRPAKKATNLDFGTDPSKMPKFWKKPCFLSVVNFMFP